MNMLANDSLANITLASDAISNDLVFKVSMTCVYALIFLIGTPGNMLVILAIVRVKELRNVRNIFIANLAVGDLTNVVWCLPTSALSLYVSWPYGEFVCKYIYPMSDVIIGNTIITVVQITIDRYRAICYPFARKASRKLTIVIVITTWLLSYVCIGLPLVGVMEVSRGRWVERSCNLQWTSKMYLFTYRFTTFFFLFVVPVFVILFCVLCIRARLNETMKLANRSIRGKQIVKRAQKNKKLINILLVIFSCFIVCVSPINLLLLDLTFEGPITKWRHAGIVFQMAIALLFFNSTMNPVILYLLSSEFKAGYGKQVKFLCPSTKGLSEAVETMQKVSSYRLHKPRFGAQRKRKKKEICNELSTTLLNQLVKSAVEQTTEVEATTIVENPIESFQLIKVKRRNVTWADLKSHAANV